MSKHPSEATLALFTGGELGRLARWRVGHHLEQCADCRRQVAAFSELREEVQSAGEVPELDWNGLAAEMKANIRLGLEAGECVSGRSLPRMVFSVRALAACTSLAALLVVSLLLEQPTPRVEKVKASSDATVIEAASDGIQLKQGDQGLILKNGGARDVNYLATGATMRARYVDADTGQVTINNVYVP
jgi:anti-sigma factor RsiW